MMTEYEIRRISAAIVEDLLSDERFITRIAKVMPKRDRLISSSKAAEILGVSRFTVVRFANELGGEQNSRGRWVFHENNLIQNFNNIKNHD